MWRTTSTTNHSHCHDGDIGKARCLESTPGTSLHLLPATTEPHHQNHCRLLREDRAEPGVCVTVRKGPQLNRSLLVGNLVNRMSAPEMWTTTLAVYMTYTQAECNTKTRKEPLAAADHPDSWPQCPAPTQYQGSSSEPPGLASEAEQYPGRRSAPKE
jgi:hypothetical protein